MAVIILSGLFVLFLGSASETSDVTGSDRAVLPEVPSFDGRPNVVLITLESVRPDHMPCYSYRRRTTPHLCRFARDAYIFDRAYTSGGNTALATSGVATGRYPFELGLTWNASKVPESVRTLPERLQESGYVFYQSGMHGLPVIGREDGKAIKGRPVGRLLDRADSPVFIRMHLWETHSPFDISAIPPGARQYTGPNVTIAHVSEDRTQNDTRLRNVYDEMLRASDRHRYRSILDSLRRSDDYNRTLVIIAGDHGEMLGEHGQYGHSEPPHYEAHIRVPLFIRFPNQTRTHRVDNLVSTIDLAPTILQYTNIPYRADAFTGVSLLNDTHDRIVVNHPVDTMLSTRYKISRCPSNYYRGYCANRSRSVETVLFRYENRTAYRVSNTTEEARMARHLSQTLAQRQMASPNLTAAEQARLQDRLRELGYIE